MMLYYYTKGLAPKCICIFITGSRDRTYFPTCVDDILLNMQQSGARLIASWVHSCMPPQSWVGLCGLPLELHIMKLVRPLPVTMVRKTVEISSIHLTFNSLLPSKCAKHSQPPRPVLVQTAQDINLVCNSLFLSMCKALFSCLINTVILRGRACRGFWEVWIHC